MPCNCGARSAGARQTIAARQREAARRMAGSPLGFSQEEPHVLGEPGGDVRRVRVLKRGVDELVVGQAAFVTGSLVDQFIASGALHDITKTQQKKRLFKVNGFTYSDPQEAQRAAAALGVKPIEVA